ncbi:DRT102 protein [Hibiscus syriacus]|uniref:DRT102 protein n=1 Tax=Hibiscus syriacus TaxID=106335 RepID=A0A6A3CRA4_HIBSY|nr:DRT102 protein [Hibiscus syriacus]
MTDSDATPLKVIAGADSFGAELKDAMVSHLRSLNIEVEDLGITSYYNIGAEVGRRVTSATTSPSVETRGLLVSLSGMATPVDTWLNTRFKSPCPASKSEPLPEDIAKFFDESMNEMPKIGASEKTEAETCAICCLVKNRELNPIDIIPGGSMKILRESPTSAIVRFKAGSVEPAHHHTFGHCLVVMEGEKSVWNLSKKERYDLGVGDYLFTPAGDVHRVKYHEDTRFFIKWDGKWDMFFDEDLETAKAAIDKELANGSA